MRGEGAGASTVDSSTGSWGGGAVKLDELAGHAGGLEGWISQGGKLEGVVWIPRCSWIEKVQHMGWRGGCRVDYPSPRSRIVMGKRRSSQARCRGDIGQGREWEFALESSNQPRCLGTSPTHEDSHDRGMGVRKVGRRPVTGGGGVKW